MAHSRLYDPYGLRASQMERHYVEAIRATSGVFPFVYDMPTSKSANITKKDVKNELILLL